MKIGILGYGRLGGALLTLAKENAEYDEILVFSNREANRKGREIDGARMYPAACLYEDDIRLDVLMLAHASKGEDIVRRLALQERYTTVDAFDIHTELEERRKRLDAVAKKCRTVAVTGVGWDPGLLSIARALCRGVFPQADLKTRWGKGVSEGHSSAIRAIPGVKKAIQYTVPTEQGHRRVCYVVCQKENEERILREIKEMPEYFLPYETEVHFIGEDEFTCTHEGACYHRGSVMCEDNSLGDATMRFEVTMQSNPFFTARIMLAYARAARRLISREVYGAFGPLALPVAWLLNAEDSLW